MDLEVIKRRFDTWHVAYMSGMPTQDITARLLAKEVGPLVAEIERLKKHIEANDAWEARLREALGDLLESLGYDCEGPFDPEADGGCANGCSKCRVEGLLG